MDWMTMFSFHGKLVFAFLSSTSFVECENRPFDALQLSLSFLLPIYTVKMTNITDTSDSLDLLSFPVGQCTVRRGPYPMLIDEIGWRHPANSINYEGKNLELDGANHEQECLTTTISHTALQVGSAWPNTRDFRYRETMTRCEWQLPKKMCHASSSSTVCRNILVDLKAW